jgi:hypothetical protein
LLFLHLNTSVICRAEKKVHRPTKEHLKLGIAVRRDEDDNKENIKARQIVAQLKDEIWNQATRDKDEEEEEESFTSEDDKHSAADDDGQAKGKGKDCCNVKNCYNKLWFLKDSDGQRSCTDRFIISLDSKIYQFWKIFVIISSIVSSYLYAFEGAFYIPEDGSVLKAMDIAFEFIFGIDMAVCKYHQRLFAINICFYS